MSEEPQHDETPLPEDAVEDLAPEDADDVSGGSLELHQDRGVQFEPEGDARGVELPVGRRLSTRRGTRTGLGRHG